MANKKRRVEFLMACQTRLVSWNLLIAGFIRNGDVESAWGIFEEMPVKDLVSWNTVLGALMQENMF